MREEKNYVVYIAANYVYCQAQSQLQCTWNEPAFLLNYELLCIAVLGLGCE